VLQVNSKTFVVELVIKAERLFVLVFKACPVGDCWCYCRPKENINGSRK